MRVLESTHWRAEAARHERRVAESLADVIHRRDRGIKDPVEDFLFQYYNLRPSQLTQWHPGLGTQLIDAPEFASREFYRIDGDRVRFDVAAFMDRRGRTVETAHRLLGAALDATPRFGCFGMHEWAMVYGLRQEETRHPHLPLRFTPERTAAIVEEVGCRCSHVDAFRFFTEPAKPLNVLQPTRENQAELDQPGCLHVNMDLYRWAGKLHPAVSSALLFECFELARDIRRVDMAASAYDLSDWGITPIRVETAEGRADYAALQRGFAARAEPLRRALFDVADALLTSRRPEAR